MCLEKQALSVGIGHCRLKTIDDAYGQITVGNQYGIGGGANAGADGSVMTAVSVPKVQT